MRWNGGDETSALRLAVGGLTRDEVRTALRSHGVQLNAHAETLLAHPAFDLRTPESFRVVQRAVGELGLNDGATLPELYRAAHDLGLALCPADTGPYLRLAMTTQPNAPDSVLSAGRSPTGSLKVAAAPLSDDVEFPKGFYLRVVDGTQWLRGYRCDDEYLYEPDDRFAFRLPGD